MAAEDSIRAQLELTDFDLDHRLLELSGVSLLTFTSIGCASCRRARRELPGMALPIERLCWVDAGDNGGLVERYGVFQLPALFVIRDGQFFGALQARLERASLVSALDAALAGPAEELP